RARRDGAGLADQEILARRQVQRRAGVLGRRDVAAGTRRRVDVARPGGTHRPPLAGLAPLALRAGRTLRAGGALRTLRPRRAGEARRPGDLLVAGRRGPRDEVLVAAPRHARLVAPAALGHAHHAGALALRALDDADARLGDGRALVDRL